MFCKSEAICSHTTLPRKLGYDELQGGVFESIQNNLSDAVQQASKCSLLFTQAIQTKSQTPQLTVFEIHRGPRSRRVGKEATAPFADPPEGAPSCISMQCVTMAVQVACGCDIQNCLQLAATGADGLSIKHSSSIVQDGVSVCKVSKISRYQECSYKSSKPLLTVSPASAEGSTLLDTGCLGKQKCNQSLVCRAPQKAHKGL